MYETTTEYFAPEVTVTITGTELLELARHGYIGKEEVRLLLSLKETDNGEED
jgi:hypothetical protein